MKRKLLALDLDGTIVNDDYVLTEESKRALARAREAGHVVAYVTGRRDVDMYNMRHDIPCADYMVLNNGGKVVRNSDGAVLYNKTIAPEDCRKLIEYALEQDLQLHICDGMTWIVTRMTEGTMDYARSLGIVPGVFRSLEETEWEKGLEGFMATCDWDPISRYIEENLPGASYVHSEPECIDIMAPGIRKWDGIEILSRLLDIPTEDVIAAGNYYNDMDMIRMAGLGVAVANSPQEVKDIADYVTRLDNNHHVAVEIVSLAGVEV